MVGSSSTDQAYATSPTSPSAIEKGGVSSGTASRVGGREGGLAGAGVPTLDSALSPTSGTPLEDRSSPTSPFDSSVVGRKRKEVYYGKQEESDLSELSQEEEESSSGEESEGYSGSDEDEGEEDDDESIGPANVATASADVRGAITKLWPMDAIEALERGMALLPNLGKSNVFLDDLRTGRSGLLAEYVRRQTGRVYRQVQVNVRLKALKKLAVGDKRRLRHIKGAVPRSPEHAAQDWSTLLGPDLYPSTNKACIVTKATKAKKRVRIKQEPKTPSSPAFPTLTASALPSSPSYPPQPSTYYRPYSDPPYHPHLPPTYSAPQPPPLPPQLAQPSSASPVLAAPPRHVPRQAPPPTPLSPRELTVFLSSSSPSHDFSRASSALQAAGLSCLEDLAFFLAFEDWSFAAFLQEAFSGLDKAERATVKAVLERARREFARR